MSRLRITLVLICTALVVGILSSAVTQRNIRKGNTVRWFREMEAFCSRVEKNVPKDGVLFVGDSHIQGLCVAAVCSRGVNLGIGGDTTAGVLRRLLTYASRKWVKAVVVAVGVNDLLQGHETRLLGRYQAILESVPAGVPLVLCGLFPVDPMVARQKINDKVWALNRRLEQLCSTRDNCLFNPVPGGIMDESGNLDPELHIGDGIHLNPAGYRIWIMDLQQQLNNLPRSF